MHIKHLLLSVLIGISSTLSAATFEQGEEKTITSPVNDNLYLAGTTIIIDAAIRGDLAVAGEQVSIHDTIYEDLLMAGGTLLINGYLADDAKIVGENIKILKNINGDLIIGGGSIHIHKDVVINGDLIIAGADVIINGTINGNVKVMGEKILINGTVNGNFKATTDELTINGTINGTSTLSSNKIALEENAQFHDAVTYWQKDGEIDFTSYMLNAQAEFSADLELYNEQENWEYMGLGFVGFGILYMLSILLTIVILISVLPKLFTKAGEQFNLSPIRNFGYGILYFFGLPVAIFLLMAIIIGLPIGFVLLDLFIYSLLFSFSISSIILAYGINNKYDKGWGKWKMIFMSLLIFIGLKIIGSIPIIGTFIAFVIIGIAFGTLLLAGRSMIKK